jgi:hypothetical protein
MLTSPDLPNTPANLIISLRMGIKQLKVLPLAGNPPNGIRQKPYQRIAPSKRIIGKQINRVNRGNKSQFCLISYGQVKNKDLVDELVYNHLKGSRAEELLN